MLIDTINLQGNRFYRFRNVFPILFLIVDFLIWLNRDPFIAQQKHPQAEIVFEFLCLLISLIGITIRILTVGFNQAPYSLSGITKADKVFHKTGMYSMVRHPLYLGNFFIWLGLIVYLQNGKLLVCYLLFFTVIYERVMITRENFLETIFGKAYRNWAKQIPAFFPNILLYKKPAERFSFRSALIFEAPIIFFTCLSFYFLEWAGRFWKSHEVETFWHCVMGTAITLTLVSLLLSKKENSKYETK